MVGIGWDKMLYFSISVNKVMWKNLKICLLSCFSFYSLKLSLKLKIGTSSSESFLNSSELNLSSGTTKFLSEFSSLLSLIGFLFDLIFVKNFSKLSLSLSESIFLGRVFCVIQGDSDKKMRFFCSSKILKNHIDQKIEHLMMYHEFLG